MHDEHMHSLIKPKFTQNSSWPCLQETSLVNLKERPALL